MVATYLLVGAEQWSFLLSILFFFFFFGGTLFSRKLYLKNFNIKNKDCQSIFRNSFQVFGSPSQKLNDWLSAK